MYKKGDFFKSKWYSNFEIIDVTDHYKGPVIVMYNEKGLYSAKPLEKFDKFLEERNYELSEGQISMGTNL